MRIAQSAFGNGAAGAVLVSCAGLAADAIHSQLNSEYRSEGLLGHWDDKRQADVHLQELGENGQFGLYVAAAVRFLERSAVWQWVEGFAELLEAAGEIDGKELIYNASQKVPKIGPSDLDYITGLVRPSKQGLLRLEDPFA